MVKKIISGGQTGVDRAALDVGIKLRIPIGGACPKGRLAEDGPIALKYPLQEMETYEYEPRTKKNVDDADATLILYYGLLMGGTALTKAYAEEKNKKLWVIDLKENRVPPTLRESLSIHEIINIAGPRESTHPGIYQMAYDFLLHLFQKDVK